MDANGWAAVGTVAAAAISVGATVTSVWQARIARRSSKAADRSADASSDQAHTARDAAASARQAAKAAKKQVDLLKRQLNLEVAAQNGRDAPVFELVARRADVGEYILSTDGPGTFVSLTKNDRLAPDRWMRYQPVEMWMTSGPAAVTTSVVPGPAAGGVDVLDGGPHRIVKGVTVRFALIYPYRATGQPLEVVITSAEEGGERRNWSCWQAIALQRS